MTNKPKPSDLSLFGISEPISQSMSKRLPQIMPVLEYIRKNKVFSATQLEKSVKVSRDSVDRTLQRLIQTKIIEIKETKARGEKLYKIKSEPELQLLFDKLKQWWFTKLLLQNKVQKGATKMRKTWVRNAKRTMHSSCVLSESYEKKQLWFVSKKRQQQITKIPYPNPVIIWNMPYSEADKIVKSFENSLLCEICFRESKISFLIKNNDEQICETGHEQIIETQDSIRYSRYDITKKSKSISYSELIDQQKEILSVFYPEYKEIKSKLQEHPGEYFDELYSEYKPVKTKNKNIDNLQGIKTEEDFTPI